MTLFSVLALDFFLEMQERLPECSAIKKRKSQPRKWVNGSSPFYNSSGLEDLKSPAREKL